MIVNIVGLHWFTMKASSRIICRYRRSVLSSKEAVLRFLEQSKGTYVSGELMARQLKITRAAVWRSIKELRADGHLIEASTRLGYRLAVASDVLSAQGVLNALLPYGLAQTDLWFHPVIGSTNREAKRLVLEGAPHGSVVLAGQQTEGRGRNGRHFFSPRESGFYLSMILRPDVDAAVALRVTCAAAVAVCRAIKRTCDLEARIKWVNDIHVNGRKVCGILTEGVTGLENGRLESIVVGIGLNHTVPAGGFPDDLKDIAGALYEHSEPAGATRNEVAAVIIAELRSLTDHLGDTRFMAEYRDRSAVIGREVTVIHGNERYVATVIDIDDNGALHVRLDDGSSRILQSGEISLRPSGTSGW